MSPFLQTLNYTSVNEDWRTEALALDLRDGQQLVCITGSGDRPLDLLAVADLPTTAIDLDPAQGHLLRLKCAAMEALPFDEYVAFLGWTERSGDWRAQTLDRLPLTGEARAFWRAHTRPIRAGVIYQGRWERHYQRLARVARWIRGADLDRLFLFDDLEAQRAWVRERWDRGLWRAAWRVATHPWTSRLLFGDPAFYAHVSGDVPAFLYERLRGALDRFCARDSFMLSLVLRGRLSEHDLPPYLTPEGVAIIRPRLHQLEIVTDDVVSWLARREPASADRLSLSDVPSYLDADGFRRLWTGVLHAAAPDARVCVRQFLTRYEIPDDLAPRLRRDPALEARLADLDRAFAYSFLVATVLP